MWAFIKTFKSTFWKTCLGLICFLNVQAKTCTIPINKEFKHILECEHLKECKYSKLDGLKEYHSSIFGAALSLPKEFETRVFPNTDHDEFLEAWIQQPISEFLYEGTRLSVKLDKPLFLDKAQKNKDSESLKLWLSGRINILRDLKRNSHLADESKMYGIVYEVYKTKGYIDGIFYINGKKWYVVHGQQNGILFLHVIKSKHPWFDGAELTVGVIPNYFYKAGDSKTGGRTGTCTPVSEMDLSNIRKYIYSILGSLEYRFPPVEKK